jgi:hypothetical protein
MKRITRINQRLWFALCLVTVSCSKTESGWDGLPQDSARLFTLLPASATGVRFENRLRETNERNVFTYRNYYNGGGVGIGDLNGDSLPDLVLTANEDGPRVYLNRGQFRFDDVTTQAGVRSAAGQWTTGVVLADVNADGLLDLYFCRAGPVAPEKRANALWINKGASGNGIPTFVDRAEQYGVADQGYSTHAAFLDYDRDGDLDLFVINNSPRPVTSFSTTNTRHVRDPFGGAQLYRNDGARFTNVSASAGIHSPEMAFGLGIGVSDVNRDGWPDIYVANDFFERDYLYINTRDGRFTDAAEQAMPVISHFSMGLDIADLDNDGWPDVYTTDMLPEDDYRLKTTSTYESWELYQTKVQNGFHHQLSRNMLQRNNQDGTFSDVGLMANVARTDWTWSALVADLDLDGAKDIFVTNGLPKDVTSQDYLKFLASDETMRAATNGGRGRVDFMRLTQAMPSTPLPDYAFRNTGGLRFTNMANAWGLATPSFSSGAAYGDLDGDGALDLVVNNTNATAFIYRNNSRRLHPENHFLKVRLEGEGANRFSVGARVTLFAGGEGSGGERASQMQEANPSRGFQSSVDYVLVFGLGARGRLDSLRVDWPDGGVSTLRDIAANQHLTVRQSGAAKSSAPPSPLQPQAWFTDVTDAIALPYKHQENQFVDFSRERLLPKLLSTEGPPLAVADVNGDGLDDMYLGGAKAQPGKLLLQQRDGRFRSGSEPTFAPDAISEDVGAVFFRANGDAHPDLYVVSGGSEYSAGASALQDRLYLNDGRGNFRKAEGHVPPESASGSRAVVSDYDDDGDVDLFVGGRVVPWRYGTDPPSMLLRNDGTGRFTDVTESLAPTLQHIGMVTDAVWHDVDGDRRADLVVVGEWMPIAIFRNTGGGRLERLNARGLEKSDGWWNRVVAADFTGDGRVDFVVGNLGLNSRLQATDSQPATMYAKDFDGNGFFEQIISLYSNGVSYPLTLRDDLITALPSLATRFRDYKDYATKTAEQIFSQNELDGAVLKRAYTFATSLARNNGDGSFTLIPLPREAQVAPVYAILADDFTGDGRADLLLAGNFDGFKPDIGRMSGSYGQVLRADGKGNFAPMAANARASGFFVPGQARDVRRIKTRVGPHYVVTRNNDRPLVFRR